MLQLLVNRRDTLRLGDVIPLGDLWDVVAHGDEVTVGFSGDKCHLFHANGEAFQRLQA